MKNEILKKVNILYVEDEDEVRTLTTSILKSLVHNLVEAANGLEGLELFKKHNSQENGNDDIKPFDLIITDINMPKMDGLKMLKEIHEIDPYIPSIITTAHNDADFLRESINQKVRGYVNKPLNLKDLIENIIIAVEPKFLKDELVTANKNLEAQVEEKTLELRSIIDSQENMILVLDSGNVTNINKTFLDFLGVDNLEEFKANLDCICELFIGDFDCDCSKKGDWIEYFERLDDIKRIVRMKDTSDMERIFQVNIKPFVYNTKHYVISFTDITELKKYTNKLKFQATHDNLTKLFNRQKLNDELNNEIARAKRYGNPFSLIMFDIDDFKLINDTYGHDVGDIVLKEIANLLNTSTRQTDIVSRWGGEEFMILCPETTIDKCEQLAQSIRKRIAAHSFTNVDKSVTISVGVTQFNKDNDKDSTIKEADIALYDAKTNGKDQVVKYEK